MERGSVSEPKNNTRQDPANATADLIAAITAACRLRGDTDANIAGLIAEAGDYSVKAQRDLIEHFAIEAARWRAATGAPA